ncbi:MAG TPA: site-specific integrase [Solirubrobacteraceae bacterium]|nr:site-specific integrase [Solirubrobacteraceae bacterium]
MQTKRKRGVRRRPVPRHPGIYYRPGPGGKVRPPYEVYYFDSSGTRRWRTVEGSLEEAEAKRAELTLRRRRGERIQPTRQSFADYATAWLERQTCRERTREKYDWALRQHLVPYFGRRRLDQITVDDVAAFIAAMQRKGARGTTILSTLQPLSMILGHAARRGAIAVNPCSQLERGERPKLDDQRPKRILSLDEMERLIACADGEQYRCLLELLVTTGVRIGEALGLAVCDLDQPGSLIRVEYQLDRHGNRSQLKTAESRRTIDTPPELMARLVALLAERGALADPAALVFASRNGTGLVRKVAREALKRAATRAKLAPPAPSLHDLRHSHASMLIALDVPVVDVQRRLGHRKPDTTLRVYTHQWKERDARRSQIGQQLGDLFHRHRELTQPTVTRLALPPGESDA